MNIWIERQMMLIAFITLLLVSGCTTHYLEKETPPGRVPPVKSDLSPR
jgi:uncharacterized protein YceK